MTISIGEELERRFLLQEEYLGYCKPVNRIEPLVSVTVITYQQARYIRDCLDGILMQKTDFPYEIIIGEDESTDGTREICKEYAEKHPDKIRLFLRDRNISHYKSGNISKRFNGLFTRMAARGKYTAKCEGDDYWIDPKKLQKQIDFLESNLNCSVCFHNAFIIDENLKNNVGCFNIPPDKNIFTAKCLFENYFFVPTASVIFRTNALPNKYPEWYLKSSNGDLALMFLLSRQGDLGLIEGYLSVYRRNAINSLSLQVQKRPYYSILRLVELLKSANLYFDRRYENETKLMCLKLKYKITGKRMKRLIRILIPRRII
jgi:glycosyltransferase involved in cell wall biosynthesis